MNSSLTILCGFMFMISCGSKNNSEAAANADQTSDTLTYAYKATYSSDVTVPSKPEIGQMVLNVWRMFENKQIDSLKKYYADTVIYENSDGYYFHGPVDSLLNFARADVKALDSLAFRHIYVAEPSRE